MRTIMRALILLVAGLTSPHAQEMGLIEPQAGSWKTWVISSGAELRVAPPPVGAATQKELDELEKIAAARDQTTPNHPSYPAAHACFSISLGRVLGYLFPHDADAFAALGERAAESRIWAGIHYRSDIVSGRQLAIAVADKVIARARQDGAEQ